VRYNGGSSIRLAFLLLPTLAVTGNSTSREVLLPAKMKKPTKLFVRTPAERNHKTVQVMKAGSFSIVLFPMVRWSSRRRLPAEWRN